MEAELDPSDEECWMAAGRGDADAFAVLFDRHADAVYRQCLWRAESASDAEDLTSMTFLEAWKKWGRVRFVEGSARPWLLVIAHNVARNHVRTSRRYRKQMARLPHDSSIADAAERDALANVEREDSVRAIRTAIARLTRADQEVVSLCDLAGLSYADAAAILDVPVGTVRSRLSRARSRLRTAVDSLDNYART